MKGKTRTSSLLLLTSIALLHLGGCSLFEPEESEVVLTVTSGTATAPGEVKITNHTDQTIYVPYIHYSSCRYFIYELEYVHGDSQFDSLVYYDFGLVEGWYWSGESVGPGTRCMAELSHVQIEPSQSFEQDIPGARLETGEYRATIRYGNLEEAIFQSPPWIEHFISPENAAEWITLTKRFSLE